MLVLKQAFLTCIFYLLFALVIEGGIYTWGIFGKGGMIGLKGLPYVIFFGILWFISFILASHVVSWSLVRQFPK
jgi:hypothetical protein